MITNSGKELIAKFLLGQVPAFATHIAVGIGARPASDLPRQITARKVANNVVELTSPGHGYRIKDIVNIYISNNNIFNGNYELVDVTKDTFSYILEHEDNDNVAETGLARLAIGNKDVLDFEVVRIPITSRGYVNDGGVTKIVFAAELPSDDRLLISEAALWSAGSNTNAQYADSRLLYNFGPAEGWKYHHGLTVEDVPVKTFMANEPPDINAPLVGKAFITASDTPVMTNASRANRYEPGRYLSNGIALRGDTSKIVSTSNTRHGALSLDSLYENEHVHLDAIAADLSKNNPGDEIKIALSVISRLAQNAITPVNTRIIFEFRHSETLESGYAIATEEIRDSDIDDSRYYIVRKQLSELETSPDFDWSKVRVVRAYVSCYDSNGNLDKDSYVLFDAVRFDNVSSPNPVYAMTGYSIYHDGNAQGPKPINKIANSSNYIEFRTNVGVV